MEAASPEQTSENGFEHNLSAAQMIAYGQEKVKKNRSTKSDKTAVQKAVDALRTKPAERTQRVLSRFEKKFLTKLTNSYTMKRRSNGQSGTDIRCCRSLTM